MWMGGFFYDLDIENSLLGQHLSEIFSKQKLTSVFHFIACYYRASKFMLVAGINCFFLPW